MDRERIRTALGFAMRAGKCLSGDFACEQAVRKRRALVVALDETVSANTLDKYESLTRAAGIPLITVDGLGRSIGRDNRMVAAVTEAGFADMIIKAADIRHES